MILLERMADVHRGPGVVAGIESRWRAHCKISINIAERTKLVFANTELSQGYSCGIQTIKLTPEDDEAGMGQRACAEPQPRRC